MEQRLIKRRKKRVLKLYSQYSAHTVNTFHVRMKKGKNNWNGFKRPPHE